jgi:plastocyanin
MRLRSSIAAISAAALVVLTASTSSASTRSVVLRDIAFKPATVKIHRGDRVRWRWDDGDTPHNVTSRGSTRFKSSTTKSTGTYVARFRRRGTYRYVCTIHPGMAGRVVVR